VSPLWGEKPIFGPLNKNNIGMPTIRGMVIEEVRPIFAPPNFFLIRSLVSLLGAIEFFLGKMPPQRENAYDFVISPPKLSDHNKT